MSYSKLSVKDDPDKLREKRDERNRKKRENLLLYLSKREKLSGKRAEKLITGKNWKK